MNRIRLGMIGGGPGSFIGAVHRKAAALDGRYELVGGAFSSAAAKSLQTGRELGLPPERSYATVEQMLQTEAAMPADQRMQVIAIVTPNHLHASASIAALEKGFHVILDKPMALSLRESQQISAAAENAGRLLALTHTYAGYPMVKEARYLVAQGKIGKLRKIYVEYPQGWLSTLLEHSGQKQASWRTDPKQAGNAGSLGDIGTHAAHLAEYVSGLKITHVCAQLSTLVAGRRLDDDVAALLQFEDEVSGVLTATQIAAGEENNLRIRLYGDKGGLEWSHSVPDSLILKLLDQPIQTYRAGNSYLSEITLRNTRLPPGHPEGYIEAFANIYTAFAQAVTDHGANCLGALDTYDFPGCTEGIRSMAFVEAMLTSNHSQQKWTVLPSC